MKGLRRLASALAIGGVACVGAAALPAQEPDRTAEARAILAELVAAHGASGAEAPVRDLVRRLLPEWAAAAAETDSAGNLHVRAGRGAPLVVFVAHLDEIGFRVQGVEPDGRLLLEPLGGFSRALFEAEPAFVHAPGGDVPVVIAPRDSNGRSAAREPDTLRADAGTGSRAASEALGLAPGQTVTMPKELVRLAGTRVTARSLDDRVGCAALILALRHLDRERLDHEVLFLWSVREETGLEGAAAAAAALAGERVARVHAVDTFVSSDAPLEPRTFAEAPLGEGAVVRAVDGSSVAPPALVDSTAALARARGIPLQLGTTGGGNDGSAFVPYGVPDVPLAWPLRYSHSPAELADLRDVVALADLVRATAEDW